jgi:hypothetical protein
MWSLLLTSLLVGGYASLPAHTAGVSGASAWHAAEFQRAGVTVQTQSGERYAFTLMLSDQRETGITFTALQRIISAYHVRMTSTARTRHWRLPLSGELRLPFSLAYYWHQAFEVCHNSATFAPHWHIILNGAYDRGPPVQVVIDLDAPPLSSGSRGAG